MLDCRMMTGVFLFFVGVPQMKVSYVYCSCFPKKAVDFKQSWESQREVRHPRCVIWNN